MTKSEKKLSQNTKHTYFNKFKACLNAAFDEGYLKENLMKKVKGFAMGESTREYLTSDELQKLSQTPCPNAILKRAFLFSALTGIRWSDVNKLKWSEVRDEGTDSLGDLIFRIVFQQKKRMEWNICIFPNRPGSYLVNERNQKIEFLRASGIAPI